MRRWKKRNEKTSPVFILSGVVGGAFLGWGGGGARKIFWGGSVRGSR